LALIADKTVKTFDLDAIHRSDCVRIRRMGDTAWRNGFVTKTGERMIEIMYSNVQNNATSYLQITAVDVAVGVWELYWTTDFQNIQYEPGAGGGDGV
jgi:hypothetical protein